MSYIIIARWVNKALRSPERFLTVPPMLENAVQNHLDDKAIPYSKSTASDGNVKFDFPASPDKTRAE